MDKFSAHIVNKKFKDVYDFLNSKNLIKGKSDMANKLGTYNHVINSILKGQRNITLDQLNKLFQEFSINANFLFGLSEIMFSRTDQLPTLGLDQQILGGRENITLVPERALAGYAMEHQDPDFSQDLQRFAIPGYEGSLTAFEINGDSMLPTIAHNDVVVCERIETNSPLYDNTVYVVVTDVVVAKRIQQIKRGNQLEALRLISDNKMYQPYDVEANEIRQILKVKCRLTSYGIR